MDLAELKARHDALRAEANLLAGGLLDIPRRAVILGAIYRDSGRNHAFSLMAAHGALWAFGYFEAGGSLGRLIAHRYAYSRAEKAYRLGILRDFAEGFRRVNRQVCIDTYANYHFTKRHGEEPGAGEVVPPSLLDALNRVHAASRAGRTLDAAERRRVFEQSFHCEQEVTVAPGVKAAVASFECRIMRFVCLHPVVRFAYFPPFRALVFRDFADQADRIAKGMRAFDLAERAGWPRVAGSLADYGLMDPAPLADPVAALEGVRRELADDLGRAAGLLGPSGLTASCPAPPPHPTA